ncbi:terminase large subunit [Clostridium phage phiCTP1]|uniref:terminase large subunit n=1 Tax=Clostridium phage phiCTP1 TaxID=871584 RepID=UPI0001E07810|nr:terminase large subunit [Clostridium phage phiCTP1]ADL40303.1 putative terminase large subunit [Clostridium phage phiCTP1]
MIVLIRFGVGTMKKNKVKPFKWSPPSLKQLKVLSWWMQGSPYQDCDAIICDGAIRSGKTVIMVLSYVNWASANFTDETFAICSKTIGAFRRNVLVPLKKMLIDLGYIIEDHRADNLITVIYKDDKSGKLISNDFYVFGGKDEASQDLIQGITLAGVFFDEVALMPESFVSQATARCSVDGSKLWFNCNPEGPFHWFYVKYIKKAKRRNALRLHFMMDDNPSLTPRILDRYKKQYSGVFYKRFILGQWVQAEGIVYSMFDRNVNVVPTKTRNYEAFYVSCDYGTKNPTVFLLWGKIGDQWVCFKEYYYDGRKAGIQKTDKQYADDYEDFIGYNKTVTIIVDPSAASFIAELRSRGYNVVSANNDVLDGIRLTGSLIKQRVLLFTENCSHTEEEFHTYVWDEKASAKGEDKVVKEHDHCMDAVRYFVNTILKYAESNQPYDDSIYKKGMSVNHKAPASERQDTLNKLLEHNNIF